MLPHDCLKSAHPTRLTVTVKPPRPFCTTLASSLVSPRGTGNSRDGVQRWSLKNALKHARSFAASEETATTDITRQESKTALEALLRYCRKTGEPPSSLLFLWRSTVYPRLIRGYVTDAETLEILRTYVTGLNSPSNAERKQNDNEAEKRLSEATEGFPTEEAVLGAVGDGLVRRYRRVSPELFPPAWMTCQSKPGKKGGVWSCTLPQCGHGDATIPPKVASSGLTKLAFVCNIFAHRMPKHRTFFEATARRLASLDGELKALPVQSLVVFAHGFSRMEGSKADVMRQLGDAILRHVHELQPRDMSVTWNAFRRGDVMHERLFQGLLKRLPAIAERFSAVQIGMTLNALGHFRIRHEQSISSLISRAKLLLGTGSPVDHVSALGEGVPKGRSSIGDTSRFGVHNLAMLLNSAARLDSVDSLLASDDGLSILVLQAVKRTVTQIFVSRGDCHEVQNLFFRDKLLPAANSRFRCCTAVLHRSGEPQPVRQEEGGTSMRGGGPYLHSKIHFKECPQDLTPQALGNIALGLGFVLANLCSFPLHGSGFHEGVRSDLQQYISLCNRCIVVLSTLSVRIFPVNPRPPPAVVTEVSSGFASLSRDAVEEGSATQVLEPAHRFQFLQALLCMWHFRGGLAPEEHGIKGLATLVDVVGELTGKEVNVGAANRQVTTSKEQGEVERALRSVLIESQVAGASPVVSAIIGREQCCSVYSIDITCTLEAGISDMMWRNRPAGTSPETESV